MSGSSSRAGAPNGRSTQEAKRRKRKERTAGTRAPEPKDIVSGAGQPLDLSVRRELEEQLGHDFSRVRLHTDRDADVLTGMLGADAVAVGQDVFFREGTYRPGTADGLRLLAHELLHTVQNPHGLGALRAGRDLGSVSLPEQTIEREAESAAQEAVRAEPGAPAQEASPAQEVQPGQATPGWLRYATVDADRRRMEQVDPATLVDRLANSVLRSLRGDPADHSKRTRIQLARMPEELQDTVLDRLETRLLSSEHERLLDLVEESESEGAPERDSLDAPEALPDPMEELRSEWETQRQTRAAERKEREKVEPPRPRSSGHSSSEGEGEGGERAEGDGREPASRGESRQGGQEGRASSRGSSGGGGAAATGEQGRTGDGTSASTTSPSDKGESGDKGGDEDGSGKSSDTAERKGQEEKKAGSSQDEDRKQDAGTSEKERSAREKSDGEESPAEERGGAGQPEREQDERPAQEPEAESRSVAPPPGKDSQWSGPVSTLEGSRAQDLLGDDKGPEDDPFGSGSVSEVDVGGGEESAWDVKLKPEDFLPKKDLDVSGVPTAEDLDPSASAPTATPSFPAPPPTKADEVHAAREAEDAEDAEAEAEPEPGDEADTAEPEPSKETEGSPEPDPADRGAPEPGSDALPGPGAVTSDPKSGHDPKAGPVDAQTTVQEAPGKQKSEATRDQAAEEEKGTGQSQDKAGGATPEKEQQKPVGATSAAAKPTAGQEGGGSERDTSSAKEGEQHTSAGDSEAQQPAHDADASDASDASGGSSDSETGTSGGESKKDAPSGASEQGSHTASPSAATSGPASGSQAKADHAPAPSPKTPAAKAPAAKDEPKDAAPTKAEPEAAPAAKGSRAGGGGGAGGGGAGGGSGGRGGAAPAKGKQGKKGEKAPNLSGMSPEAGLSAASRLKPHQALQAMGGVGGAVNRSVGDEHKKLASSPPSLQRPAGAPRTARGGPNASPGASYSQDPGKKADAPEKKDAKVTGAKKPEGDIPAAKAEEPSGWDTAKMAVGWVIGKVGSWFDDDIDPTQLAAKFGGLPTKDEALKKAKVGQAPGVELKGAADQKADEQSGHLDDKGQETVATGRDDASRPMGEDQVYPDAPKEQLRAKVPGQEGGKGGVPHGGAGTGAVPPEAASKVAEHDRGPQFHRAFSQGHKGMAEGRKKKDHDFRASEAKHKKQVHDEIASNSKSQAGQRKKAMAEVSDSREQWRRDQDKELKSLGTKKTEKHEKLRKDVKDKQEKTDKDVDKEQKDGDKKVVKKSDDAEKEAHKKREDSKKDSKNWVSKALDWIKQKFIEIRDAIVNVFKRARDAVVNLIKNFKDTVVRWINEARKFIVDFVKKFIEALIEFAKALIRTIMELAARIRKLIISLLKAALALVTKLANMLKQAIKNLLDFYAKLLSSILSVLKKMLMDVVKSVMDAIKQVMQFASKLLSMLGDFLLIAIDFLDDPKGWLSGAKNSAVDGAKHHLFAEVKSAVKKWFQSKIEEIIGVPKAIIEKLIKGGFTLEKIVKETWDAVVPMLPFIIGEIVITKVVAKLIPGAGWVMAVIDAIQTAIGALGAILRAIGAVISWLKAVRSGGAGILFAKAVAAGIVALLELAYQALLSGIGKYVGKVGKRLKAVAAKLGKGKFGKGRKGKGAGAEGSDDKGGKGHKDQHPEKPGEKKPSDDEPASPLTKSEATHPKADGDKPAGAGKPDRGKPDPDKHADGPSKKPTHDKDGKPGKDGDGKKPQHKDDDKDTRPTPSAKPKPKPREHPKPKHEPEPKPKPKKDKNPDESRPKDHDDDKSPHKDRDEDQDPNRPKDRDDDPSRPKDKDPDKPRKPKDKDSDGKPRHKDDKDGPGRKPKKKHDKDGDGKGPKKPGHHKDKDGKPKDKDPKEKQEKKDKRKEEEESKESKEQRLAKIVARLRPKAEALLSRGVPAPILKAFLGAARVWYRLTELSMTGRESFSFRARLNPTRTFSNGATVDTVRLLRFLRQVGREVVYSNTSQEDARTRIHLGHGPRGSTGNQRPVLSVEEGVGFGAIQNYGRRMAPRRPLQWEDIDLERSNQAPLTISRKHGFTPRGIKLKHLDPTVRRRNKVVNPKLPEAPRTTSTSTPSNVKDAYSRIINNVSQPGIDDVIADLMAQLLRGGRISGANEEAAAALTDIMADIEGQRSISATTTSALIIDGARNGSMSQGISRFQMIAAEAQSHATELNRFLYTGSRRGARETDLSTGAQNMMHAELEIVEEWINTLNIKVNRSSKKSTEDQLCDQIRKRVHELYGTRPEDVQAFQARDEARRRGMSFSAFLRMYQQLKRSP